MRGPNTQKYTITKKNSSLKYLSSPLTWLHLCRKLLFTLDLIYLFFVFFFALVSSPLMNSNEMLHLAVSLHINDRNVETKGVPMICFLQL